MDLGSTLGSGQPQLLFAVEQAYKTKALLVVSSKNRLSQQKSFFKSLKNRGIEFISIDEENINQQWYNDPFSTTAL